MQKRTNEPQRRLEEESQNPQPAEPVKVPSDSAIMFEWSQTPNTGDMRVDLIAFARALLARYGQRSEPADAEPLWCLHILGPDDVHPAPSKAYAEVAADLHNARFADISKESGVLCKAVAARWPHDAQSHASGVANFVENWIAPTGKTGLQAAGEWQDFK